MRLNTKQRGDTLIEVLLAMAVLSLAAVGLMSIMNFSFSKGLDTTARTKALALVSGQANMLHAARDAYSDGQSNAWQDIVDLASNGGVEADGCETGATPFVLDPTSSSWIAPNLVDGGVAEQSRPTVGEGVWVEAYRTNSASIAYYDFYVKACWPGQDVNQQIKTVVRLYEPTS